ncbi:MAG: hypothetical protein ACK5OX_15910 [Desertimonas sp.]
MISSTTTTIAATSTTTREEADEALRRQIAADFFVNVAVVDAIVANPSLDGVDARLAEPFEPGSAAFVSQREFIEDLVATGDVVIRNEPDLVSVAVERIDLVGAAPYTEAVVTACEVGNRRRVTPAANSPTGQEIQTAGTGQLFVLRYHEPVRLSAHGWVSYQSPREAQSYEGVQTCPPE